MICEYVKARNIDEIHFKLIRRLFQAGQTYIIDRGSYVGHKRLEFDFVTAHLTHPSDRPLAPQMPSGVPSVTDEESIEKYFLKYIMNDATEKQEIYSYGQYILPQVAPVIKMFKEQGEGTNQATISVGNVESIHQEHPPCLRLIDIRLRNNKINFVTAWRSWDCFSGLPENLGGLQLLKEYIGAAIGAEDGEMISTSKGLHLYDFQWPAAFARLGSTLPDDSVISEEEAQTGEGWMIKGK